MVVSYFVVLSWVSGIPIIDGSEVRNASRMQSCSRPVDPRPLTLVKTRLFFFGFSKDHRVAPGHDGRSGGKSLV